MKNNFIKYIIISCLLIILILTGFSIYSNNLNNKLNEQIKIMLSEIGNQNKLVVASEINKQQDLVNQLALTLSSKNLDEEIIPLLQNIYDTNDYKNVGIVARDKTIYITRDKVEVKNENYYDELENKDSVIVLDKDPINNQMSIFIGEGIQNKEALVFYSYDLYNLVNKLSVPSFNGNGYTYIVDNKGNKILKSDNPTSFYEFDNIFDAMIDADKENINQVLTLEQDFKNLKSDTILFYNDSYKQMYYTPLGINDWYILTVVPVTTIDNIYNEIMTSTLLVSIYLLIIFLVIFLTASLILHFKNKKLYNAIYKDKLTGGYSYERFKEEYNKLDGNKTLVIFDINNFKLLNTIYGYDASNEVLNKIYNILIEVNKDGFSCRKTADHYLICIKHHGEKTILSYINKIYNSIRQIKIENSDFVLTSTFGIYEAFYAEEFEVAENKAIVAWKIAKNDRNIFYAIYEDKMVYDMVESKNILDKLMNAVDNNLLEIYLQPKFDCKTSKMVGAEALLRLKENNHFISPSVFIPIAEETGFITTIDSYVFENVCKIISNLKKENILLGPVSINVSRKKIEQYNIVSEYEEIMDKYKIKKEEIELEVTEGTILSDNTVIKQVMKKIKKAKFRILVDDFGTGYSSISMLKSMDIDGIKIDRSFIIDETEKGKEILKYVTKLGKSLNLQLTAEGVETKEQLDYLKKLNCDIIQGYYFSKPLSINELKKFLEGDKNE